MRVGQGVRYLVFRLNYRRSTKIPKREVECKPLSVYLERWSSAGYGKAAYSEPGLAKSPPMIGSSVLLLDSKELFWVSVFFTSCLARRRACGREKLTKCQAKQLEHDAKSLDDSSLPLVYWPYLLYDILIHGREYKTRDKGEVENGQSNFKYP